MYRRGDDAAWALSTQDNLRSLFVGARIAPGPNVRNYSRAGPCFRWSIQNMKSYVFCLSLVLVNLAPCAERQSDSHESVTLRGEVEASDVSGFGLVVVLSTSHEVDRRADVGSGGGFEFSDVPSGHYRLSVTTLNGDMIHHEYVSL